MSKTARDLIAALEALIEDAAEYGGTEYRETIRAVNGINTRVYRLWDSAIVLMDLLQTERKAAETGQPAKHSRKTLAQARTLIELAQWHKPKPGEISAAGDTWNE